MHKDGTVNTPKPFQLFVLVSIKMYWIAFFCGNCFISETLQAPQRTVQYIKWLGIRAPYPDRACLDRSSGLYCLLSSCYLFVLIKRLSQPAFKTIVTKSFFYNLADIQRITPFCDATHATFDSSLLKFTWTTQNLFSNEIPCLIFVFVR